MDNLSTDSTLRTLVILKPETLERKIVGEVLQYFDRAGFKQIAMEQFTGSDYKFRKHYKDVLNRVDKNIGDDIIRRMTRGDCIFIVYEAPDVIRSCRNIVGATDPAKAAPYTIRAKYGVGIIYNVAHASDSPESAGEEIALWFPELCESETFDANYKPNYYTGC
jgi:nucleoside-diphosphate kinase